MRALRDVTAPKVEQRSPLNGEEFTYIDISSIDTERKRIVEPKRLQASDAPSRAKQLLRKGDVLVSMTRPNRNAVAIVPPELDGAIGSTGFHVLRAGDEVDPRWLFNAVQTKSFIAAMEELVQGALYPAVRPKDIQSYEISVPSLAEQRIAVAEIEKQFSRLDEAVANLKRVKANLKRYKAAVLKAAVEGRLVPTEAELARNEARTYECARQLLDRISATRRTKWNRRSSYMVPFAPANEYLAALPEGWIWVRLDAIASLKGGITVDRGRKDSSARLVPYLRVANVQRNYLDLSEIKYIAASESDIEQLRLLGGDILFNEGGDRDKLGRGWIWEGQLPNCIHQNHVFRARLASADLQPKLVSWWGNSFGKDYFAKEGKQTTNLASINITKLSAFPVPLPPVAEQKRIVAELERRFSLVQGIENQTELNLKRAASVRQSILSAAFSLDLRSSDGQQLFNG